MPVDCAGGGAEEDEGGFVGGIAALLAAPNWRADMTVVWVFV